MKTEDQSDEDQESEPKGKSYGTTGSEVKKLLKNVMDQKEEKGSDSEDSDSDDEDVMINNFGGNNLV